MDNSSSKVVDTQEYVGMLKDLVDEGKEVSMIVWGDSMTPFLLHNRDRIFFSYANRELRKGDIVFYQRRTGQFVVHRIYKIIDGKFYLLGDAQTAVEGPIEREQIFALVTMVQRNGKMIATDRFSWRVLSKLWMCLRRLRPHMLSIIRRLFI